MGRSMSLLSNAFIWCAIVTVFQTTVIPNVPMDLLSVIMPVCLFLLDRLMHVMFGNSGYCPIYPTCLLWGFACALLCGIRLNMFLIFDNYTDLFISCAIDSFFEMGTKLKPAIKSKCGYETSDGTYMYMRSMITVEYLPVVVYFIFIISDWSPFSQMVITSEHGCSGT